MLWAALPLLLLSAHDVADRQPVALLSIVPPHSRSAIRTPQILDIGDDVLRELTGLRLELVEAWAVDRDRLMGCPLATRLSCWAEQTRRAAPDVDHLLVVSPTRASHDGGAILVILIDLRELDLGRSPSAREQRLFRSSVVEEVRLATVDEAAVSFDALVRRIVTKAFVDTPRWRPFGSLAITVPPGAAIELDGLVVATATSATVRVDGVTIGPHRVTAAIGDRPAGSVSTVVRRGETNHIEFALAPAAVDNRVALYSGLTLAALGVAVVVFSVAASPAAEYYAVCPRGQCPERQGASFARPCQLGDNDETCASDPRGLLVAPFGGALIITGAGTALGATIFETDTPIPWKSIALSLLVGVAFYGASVIVGSDQPLGLTMP